MEKTLPEILADLLQRKERFLYDIRSRCQVYDGVVAAYRTAEDGQPPSDLATVMAHALEHDGIIGGWKDPDTQQVMYDSCRLFTDHENAFRFARQQQQKTVFNLTRNQEMLLDPVHERS